MNYRSTCHPNAVMESRKIDVSIPIDSYFIGLVMTDGHISRTRTKAKLEIELGAIDRPILDLLSEWLGFGCTVRSRTRDTNFSEGYESVSLTVTRTRLIDQLIDVGVPAGKKSALISTPNPAYAYSVPDFWRGILDGDGSIGITATDQPFISLVTQSQSLADAYKSFVFGITGHQMNTNRNKRDGVFNLVVLNESARTLADYVYYSGCVGIPRKVIRAKQVSEWVRPANREIGAPRKDWDMVQDEYLWRYGYERTMATFGRTFNSVNLRFRKIRWEYEMHELDDG